MEEPIRTYVIMCGYGCTMTQEYRRYLDEGRTFINREKPYGMVLSGAGTQRKSRPGKTEAETMLTYLEASLQHNPYLFMEEEAFTSYENIRGACRAIEAHTGRRFRTANPPRVRLVIFCEASRALKVSILAWGFFGFMPRYGLPHIEIRTTSWELKHPLAELAATVYDACSLFIPGLAWLWGYRRRQRAKTA